MNSPDLATRRHIHIVGIGGAGMSAIATVLVGMGHAVSGSDLKESSALARLRGIGVRVELGHRAENVGDADLLAVSTAIPADNPEVQEAQQHGVAVLRRAELLAAITARRRTIAVSGTHGKTTTTSMVALAMVEAGLAPAFIVGGDITELGANAAWDEGDWLVVEADESDGTFVEIEREIAVVTNVEPDHLDHYGSFASLRSAFQSFVDGARLAIVSADDEHAAALAPSSQFTFGFADAATFRVVDFVGGRASSRFVLATPDGERLECTLAMPGRHNARNAAAAAAAAMAAGADHGAVVRALARFAGVSRRFEFRGEAHGATVVDDYAHLPSEVQAALDTARQGGFTRVVCVFQPHRFTRVASLWRDFTDAFVGADVLIVTDIYAAGEAPRPGVSATQIVDAVLAAHPAADVRYRPERGALVEELRATLRPGDCCLVLGAGDVVDVSSELLADAHPTR